MMRRGLIADGLIRAILIVAAVLAFTSLLPAQSPIQGFPPGVFQNRAALDAAAASGCAAATTFVATLTGGSGNANAAYYTTMICGMIADGNGCSSWSGGSGTLDRFYIFETTDATSAKLDLCGHTGITVVGTETFAANAGYTGDGSTGYLNPTYTPSTSAINVTQNSAVFGTCQSNSRTSGSMVREIGGLLGGTYWLIDPLNGSNDINAALNDADGGTLLANPTSNAQGSYTISRTSSTGISVYQNGSSVGTQTQASVSLLGNPIFIGAFNSNGTAIDFSTDQIAYAFWGGGLTGTPVTQIYNRIHTYSVSVGNSAC